MPDDFSNLKEKKYSGRGIIIGMTPEGNIYFDGNPIPNGIKLE